MTHIPNIPSPSMTSPGMPHAHEAHSLDPQQVMATRELFWQNVIREILTSLSMICALRPAATERNQLEAGAEEDASAAGAELNAAGAMEADGAGAGDDAAIIPVAMDKERASFDAQLFDGRMAIITRRGERIPIADVFPLFACGIDTPRERVLSLALECTVFQIRTPAGEVYTLPLHEIGSFQALAPELMRRLAQMARKRQEQETGESVQQPFGFAAFTSISKETPPPMTDEEG